MLTKNQHFVAINSCISGEVGARFQSKTCTIPLDNYSSIQNWLCFVELTVSSITKCLNTSTICRKVTKCDKKLCVVLIEADIFNKAMQANIPKPLRNLYIKFDVNTLRHCGEMACAEEN